MKSENRRSRREKLNENQRRKHLCSNSVSCHRLRAIKIQERINGEMDLLVCETFPPYLELFSRKYNTPMKHPRNNSSEARVINI